MAFLPLLMLGGTAISGFKQGQRGVRTEAQNAQLFKTRMDALKQQQAAFDQQQRDLQAGWDAYRQVVMGPTAPSTPPLPEQFQPMDLSAVSLGDMPAPIMGPTLHTPSAPAFSGWLNAPAPRPAGPPAPYQPPATMSMAEKALAGMPGMTPGALKTAVSYLQDYYANMPPAPAPVAVPPKTIPPHDLASRQPAR